MSSTTTFDKADHALDLINRLYEMRKEERHCDFVIKVGSEKIPAHRNVLTAMSDYFDRMLFHDTIENSSGMVDMKNVDPDCVRICVDFMYGRKVEVPEDKYEDLMHVTNLMQLVKLAKIVENVIGQKLSMASFFAAKRIADMFGCQVLQSYCVEFAKENFVSISMKDEFGDLDKNFITDVIKSRNVKMTEEEKFDALLRWVEHDVESRSKDLDQLFEFIRLRFVPIENRQQLVHENYLKNNANSVRILCSSIVNSLKKEIEKGKEKAIIIFDNKSGHLQQFRPRFNKWKRMQEMNDDMKVEFCPGGSEKLCAIVYGDIIYVFARHDSRIFHLKYNDKDATWKEIGEDHGELPTVVVQGKLFDEIEPNADWVQECVKHFDPETLKWSELLDKYEDSPGPGSALLVMRGYIYLFGGSDHRGFIKDVQRYDPTTSEWKEMKPMSEAKGFMAAVELDDKAYIMGGYIGYDLASVECYDSEMDQWTNLAPMLIRRSFFRAFAIDDCIYAVGGDENDFPFSLPKSIEKYDVKKNKWTMVQLPKRLSLGIFESVGIQLD